MFLPGAPPECIGLICQARRDSHKVKVKSASIVPSMHLGKSYRAFLPSSPLRSPRQWSELPEGPLGLILISMDGQLSVRRPSAMEIWVWMRLPSRTREAAAALALPELPMFALAAAAVAGCQGRAITATAMHRAQATLAFTASAWSPSCPPLSSPNSPSNCHTHGGSSSSAGRHAALSKADGVCAEAPFQASIWWLT